MGAVSGLVRYVVLTPIRIAVFNAVALVGYAWVTSPEAFRAAVNDGVDVGAVVDLALGVPNFLPIVGVATLLALLWPVIGGGSGGRRRHGPYDDYEDYDDGGGGFFDGGGGDGGGGGGE